MPPPGSRPATDRNAPCPCGSGKKYKKCCLGKADAGVSTGDRAARAPDRRPGRAPTVAQQLAAAEQELGAGRLDRAETLLRAVLLERPRDGKALFGLGRVRAQRGDAAGAIDLFEEAIAADPRKPQYHVTLAEALQQAGRIEDALAAAGRAAEIDPRSAPAHTMVAICHDRMNRIAPALDAARAALIAAPGDANASILLARLEGRDGRPDVARRGLEAVLARRDLAPFLRQMALNELGVACDRLKAYDDAFAAFAECGREIERDPLARRLDRDAWFRRVETYRNGLTAETLRRFTPETFAGERPAPAFLVGFPRSGTTMTEQVLAAHPGVVSTDEREMLRAVKNRMIRVFGGGEDVPSMLERLDEEHARNLRRLYWERAAALTGSAVPEDRLFLDKLPLNIVDVAFINVIFPDARIIVALRDPRDVCLSCLMQWFGLNTAMVNFLSLERTADFYAVVMGYWLHVRSMLTTPWIEVRYEDTVRDLETQARRILGHLGLPWSDDVLRFHEKSRERFISTPSFTAVTEAVHTRAVARWRRYETHLAPVAPRLAPFVEAFGYDDGG